MADKRGAEHCFDDLLAEPFERMEALVSVSPIDRCNRMLAELEELDAALTRIIEDNTQAIPDNGKVPSESAETL